MNNKEELQRTAQKIIAQGGGDVLKSGEIAITVNLGTPNRIYENVTSWDGKKAALRKQFQDALGDLINKGMEVDYGAMSITGQTVPAKLSVSYLNTLIEKLTEKKLEIYPVIKRKMI